MVGNMTADTVTAKKHIESILASIVLSRDSLPYSEEFERLFAEFAQLGNRTVTRQQFWRLLSNVCKKGGQKGKRKGPPAPVLTHQQNDILRTLLVGRFGERDSLPYTGDFSNIKNQFNSTSGIKLKDADFWRAMCGLCKQQTRLDANRLLDQSIASLTKGLNDFNNTSDVGRPAAVLISLLHACEMLLKAGLMHRGCNIRDTASGYAYSLDTCLSRAVNDTALKFMSAEECLPIRVLNGFRDQAQHYFVAISEQLLYTVSQSTVTIFGQLLARLFAVSLSDKLPRRVLPLSTTPPESICIVMDDEFTEIKKLLKKGRQCDILLAEAKLRGMMAMNLAIEGMPTQVPGHDLAAAKKSVAVSENWGDIFPGIAQVKMTVDGTGVNVSLTIKKHDGLPVRITRSGEIPDATLTVRKLIDSDVYCFGVKKLGELLKITSHQVQALAWKLDIKSNPEYFKVITHGKSSFKLYSQQALDRLREELINLDITDICKQYSLRTKV